MTDLADACALPVPRLPMADLAPEVDERAKATGTTALLGQFGHAPGLIESWLAWYQPLMVGGRVPVRTKELCRLAVASRTGLPVWLTSSAASASAWSPASCASLASTAERSAGVAAAQPRRAWRADATAWSTSADVASAYSATA